MKKVASLVLVLALSGCVSNLQASYVEAMEKTYNAVLMDVEAELYKPDEHSTATLNAWKKANEDARAALEVEGKITPLETE
jgi:hypothetical protein